MDDKREVIELVNKLQGYKATTGCEIKIQLPQIVVVGSQSSGKSSVLDGLIGSSILPRGSGTVTKCPIIVQLITIPDASDEGIEFPDAPELQRIKDYDVVRAKLWELMEMLGGAIKEDPIIVKVFSPNVVTLTVVDLPGIKRLVTFEEPENLEKLIFDLSRKYIQEKNAIILAVSPANYDICNSDGILLAKEADPLGNRTIGVLTKLDLMDAGTNARDLLTGMSKDANVKLGMIGLINRSQQDINNNLSVKGQLKKERKYLNETYPDLADRNGVPFLRKRLHELLVQHILKYMPVILNDMEVLLKECQESIDAIPDVETPKDKQRFVFKIIQGFENCMKKEIEGCTRNPDYKYVYGGIKIKDVFEKKFAKDMETAGRKTNEHITDDMILRAFRNSGAFDSFFVYPEAVFRKLAQEQVKQIEEPALKCAQRVHDEIVKIADRHLSQQRHEFSLFPEFRKSIKSVVHSMLDDNLGEVKKQIKDYIRVQASVVFSMDKQFMDKLSKLRRQLEKNLNGDEDEKSDAENAVEQQVIQSIRSNQVVNDRMMDMLPSVPTGRPTFNFKPKNISLTNSERMYDKLKNPSTTKLIKDMVNMYFHHIKMHTQDYIPKLVADRLITQFSSDDGNLGEELRIQVVDNCEELVKLPTNVSEKRGNDVKLMEKYDDESGYSDHGNASSDDEI